MYHQRFKSLEERLAEKYHVAENGCWVWNTGKADSGLYPFFWDGKKHVRASQFVWARENGREVQPGEQILHRCDNTRCVNPDHLFLGDTVANMQDRKRKGRGNHPKGERNGRARITRFIADDIRRRYAERNVSQQSLADKFGISQQVVSAIIRGKVWL